MFEKLITCVRCLGDGFTEEDQHNFPAKAEELAVQTHEITCDRCEGSGLIETDSLEEEDLLMSSLIQWCELSKDSQDPSIQRHMENTWMILTHWYD